MFVLLLGLGWVGYRTWGWWWFAGDTNYTTDGLAGGYFTKRDM